MKRTYWSPCRSCGEMFESKRRDAACCSPKCRKAVERARQVKIAESRIRQRSLFAEPVPAAALQAEIDLLYPPPAVGVFEVVKGAVPLDNGKAPVSSKCAPEQSFGSLPAASVFDFPPEVEIGGLLKVGDWEPVQGDCWQRVARFERGFIVLEAYAPIQPGDEWTGCLKWLSVTGVTLRYSYYVTDIGRYELCRELDAYMGERLAMGEGG